MDHERIERVIMEEVKEVIESQLFDIRFTLKGVIRRIYWPSYERGEVSEKTLMKLDDLIDLAFNTTYRAGPEGETYPCLDERKAKVMLIEIQKLLNLDKSDSIQK